MSEIPSSNPPNPSVALTIATPTPTPAPVANRGRNSRGGGSVVPQVTRKDRERWLAWRRGEAVEDIAAAQKVTVTQVNFSIQKFLSYQHSVSHESVDMKANELLIENLEGLKPVFQEARVAMRQVQIAGEDGKPAFIEVPDLKTRLSVADRIAKLMQAQRKDGGVTINNNNTQNNTAVLMKGKTTEERIRAIRERHQLRNDAENIVDAKFSDAVEEDDADGEYGEDVLGEGDEEGDECELVEGDVEGETNVTSDSQKK